MRSAFEACGVAAHQWTVLNLLSGGGYTLRSRCPDKMLALKPVVIHEGKPYPLRFSRPAGQSHTPGAPRKETLDERARSVYVFIPPRLIFPTRGAPAAYDQQATTAQIHRAISPLLPPGAKVEALHHPGSVAITLPTKRDAAALIEHGLDVGGGRPLKCKPRQELKTKVPLCGNCHQPDHVAPLCPKADPVCRHCGRDGHRMYEGRVKCQQDVLGSGGKAVFCWQCQQPGHTPGHKACPKMMDFLATTTTPAQHPPPPPPTNTKRGGGGGGPVSKRAGGQRSAPPPAPDPPPPSHETREELLALTNKVDELLRIQEALSARLTILAEQVENSAEMTADLSTSPPLTPVAFRTRASRLLQLQQQQQHGRRTPPPVPPDPTSTT